TAQLLPLKSQHTIHSNYKFWLTPAKVGKAGGLAKPKRKIFAIDAGGVAVDEWQWTSGSEGVAVEEWQRRRRAEF
ncbi:MAG: hypothetical protein KIG28_00155, partial [Bacteroidales bacterium]|nr:hypothetical protein [Bacteroidales bacterium]